MWLSGAAAAFLVLRLVIGAFVGLHPDEAYYAFWARWPSFTYLDHPPGVALQIAAGRAFLGPGQLAVRISGAIVGLIHAGLVGIVASRLIAHPLSAPLAMALFLSAPLTIASFVVTPDQLSGVIFLLGAWFLAEALHDKRPMWWLFLGAVAGLGLAAKMTNALSFPGIALALLTLPEGRRQAFRWPAITGAIIAFVIAGSALALNAGSSGGSLAFQARRITDQSSSPGLAGGIIFLGTQLAVLGPALLPALALGTVQLMQRRGMAQQVASVLPLLLISLPTLGAFGAFSLLTTQHANWTAQAIAPIAIFAAALVLAGPNWFGRLALVAQLGWGALCALGFLFLMFVPGPWSGLGGRLTESFKGWEYLGQALVAEARRQGVTAIYLDANYGVSAEIALLAENEAPDLLVRPLRDPVRYAFIPPAHRFPQRFPALLVQALPAASPGPTDYFVTALPLGTFVRTPTAERFALYRVWEAGPAFPLL